MLTWIIVILLILWLLGYFGPSVYSGIPASGNVIHTLLVIALILFLSATMAWGESKLIVTDDQRPGTLGSGPRQRSISSVAKRP